MTPTPTPLWTPDARRLQQSRMKHFIDYLFVKKGLYLRHYDDLWNWSVANIDDFWEVIAAYFDVKFHAPYRNVIERPRQGMIGTRWFTGATVSYAEHIFRNASHLYPALLYASERNRLRAMSWSELTQQVGALAEFLRQQGVGVGDRVVALLPNVPEAVVGFLATQSLGAVWSSCSPDFGTASVLDRFRQIEPTVLLMADGYTYNGKPIDKTGDLTLLRQGLPSLKSIVWVPFLNNDPSANIAPPTGTTLWADVLDTPFAALTFEPVPFDSPLWILFSSGTTGKPKAITHSVGGCLLEHLKTLALHQDVQPGERYFWYSTTGWMMWNFALASMLVGATLVLYEGSPAYPDLSRLWMLAEQAQINHFGGGAAYFLSCMRQELKPSNTLSFKALRSIGSTGSPLPPEGFRWIYENVRTDVWLISFSGGTDVCSGFVGGNPFGPVVAGEIQCRLLGCHVEAFDEAGQPVREELGEMMILEPMPSMPLYFWGDQSDDPARNNERYRASYFEQNPNVWRHGDWIKITDRGTVIIYGRSDATLNRDGVRIGTAEIYSAVESLPEIADSLVVGIEHENGTYEMPLFVALRDGQTLSDDLKTRIKQALRNQYSPRHVPDSIHQIAEVPYTISGKKMETPVKKILMGQQPDRVASPDTMRNPGSLKAFQAFEV
ncbi:acetoacetate--CoA ligase [Fibrella sp. HMF5335]|uniref:Acetoacetate--CoA ligase n=1 Tax=Fibrella rubiginis TaxID=2817060 RepID=A0A939GN87_9BACT|nr:acetoacetate--CoA ligase [Fibrella rubiginis]MBO0939921.1 acetoacetate--CoA ligase [Fibrella rubiginis]